jgi:holo-[acyl-carrier protein] synthase
MILGIGSDMVSIERIEGTIQRFGVRFVQRVFSETEKKTAEYRASTTETYAKRWGA